jgi:hypothetical protein
VRLNEALEGKNKMKLTNDEFRTLTRNFLSEALEGNERRQQLIEAGQMTGEPTTTLNPETDKWEVQDETGHTLQISAENAEAVEKAKSAIEQQLNSLYHDHMLENADLIAILEQMINDISSGFVGEPT